MEYTSATFWLCLLPALVVLLAGDRVLRGREKARNLFHRIMMLVVSVVLISLSGWVTLGIFAAVSMAAYGLCHWGLRCGRRGRRVMLWFTIPLLLLPLLYYKYGYFIGVNVFREQWDTLKDLVIPLGISFYTFQIIGFCIDTLTKEEQGQMPGLLDYLNFCAFFPRFVAGPIERRAELLPQMQRMELHFTAENVNIGLRYIILGLFFKMALADNLAYAFWDKFAWDIAWMVWCNNLIFTFRIYFDFAGYALSAYGLAKCMGITLRMNFMSPYTATNVRDFWRRWHTSLTSWFTEYIYFPMGGSRTKRWALNMIIVFLISGLWHGAAWNFVLWGGLAGVALVIHRVFRNHGWQMWAPFGWGLTFGMTVLTWMFFYDTDPELLSKHLQCIFSVDAYSSKYFIAACSWKYRTLHAACIVPMLLLSFAVLLGEYWSQRKSENPYHLLLHPYACGVEVFLTILLQSGATNQFIYAAF
ncbi:MAG: hypothetical protein MJ058_08425 [Akkermansia sp.]|nr:hypothetical protein [Akkermansia sp.]